MVAVDVRDKGGETKRLVFHKPEVTIGRFADNDIVLLAGNVSGRHARIVVRDGKHIIVDLKSTNGTYIDGRRLTSPIVLVENEHVSIGDFLITVCPTDDLFETESTKPVPAVELRLLTAVIAREPGSRLVYADWLEEQGDAVRAEFLRTQEAIAGRPAEDVVFQKGAQRLRFLASQIDVQWRYKVARVVVENCLSFELVCRRSGARSRPRSDRTFATAMRARAGSSTARPSTRPRLTRAAASASPSTSCHCAAPAISRLAAR